MLKTHHSYDIRGFMAHTSPITRHDTTPKSMEVKIMTDIQRTPSTIT